MGHRANLVLVEHGSATVYYGMRPEQSSGARPGAHPAVGASAGVGRPPSGGWLDELWAQGGLTADLDRHRLVWFDIPAGSEPRRRRVILAMLARTWRGWTVQYAARGIGDVAEAAGVPRRRVGDPGPEVRPTATVDVTARADEVAAVVAHAGELMSYYLAAEPGLANRPGSTPRRSRRRPRRGRCRKGYY